MNRPAHSSPWPDVRASSFAPVRRLCRALGRCGFIVLVGSGCRAAPSEQSPEWVVQEFVERMRRVHGDPESARGAYELLWLQAQQNLAERARRASALAGHKVAPEEMLAPSRFSLEFEPKEYSARIDGLWAEVTVTGEAPATQRRTVLVMRDGGSWRVVLKLPLLPPIRHRPNTEQ